MKWFFSPPFLSVSPFLLLNLARRQCYAYAIGLYTRPEIKSWPDVKFRAHAQGVLPRCSHLDGCKYSEVVCSPSPLGQRSYMMFDVCKRLAPVTSVAVHTVLDSFLCRQEKDKIWHNEIFYVNTKFNFFYMQMTLDCICFLIILSPIQKSFGPNYSILYERHWWMDDY